MDFGERGQIMPQKRHTAEEIIQPLRTVEIERVKGVSLEQASRKIGVTPTTLARWKAEFGGLRVDQAKRLKQLEQENTRLRKIVSDQSLDILILKEVSRGNF
jgi:transposase-like protein|tara:strand:+ start:162 stop:467 length:306 start_codon:yes stop_codon:yes gene_type:complete